MINRVNFALIPFPPIQWSGDVFQLAQLLAEHLQGNLDNSVFSGQSGGTEPQTDIGLWLNDDLWEHWDAELAKYVPLRVAAGIVSNGVLHKTTLAATSTTGDITLELPDKAGKIALTEDVLAPQETDTQSGNTISIDWKNSKVYSVISGNATVSDAGGGADGKSVELFVETPPGHGSALTITFPAAWRISGATLSTTDATHRAVDKFLIEQIGTDIFVDKISSYSINQAGVGGDTIKPTFVSARITRDTSLVKVVFSELITGVTTPAKWLVKKNGNTQSIDSTVVTGNQVRIDLSSTVGANSSVTVQYTGTTEVKDLAGNFANPFSPQTVDVIG